MSIKIASTMVITIMITTIMLMIVTMILALPNDDKHENKNTTIYQ